MRLNYSNLSTDLSKIFFEYIKALPIPYEVTQVCLNSW